MAAAAASGTRRVSRRGIPVRSRSLSSGGGVSSMLTRSVRRSWTRRRSATSSCTTGTLRGAPRPRVPPRAESAHDVRPEEVSQLQVFVHRRVTRRPRACSRRAQRGCRPALDRPQRCVGAAGDLALRARGSTRGLAPRGGRARSGRGRKQDRSCARARPLRPPRPARRRIAAHGSNPGAAAADQVRRPVARDAVCPGREARPRRVEARSVPPHGSEHVLHEVFGERPVPEIPHTCSVYEAGITVVQLRERAPLRPVPPALPEPRPRRLSLRASPNHRSK